MVVPEPPVKLEGHCSVIHDNTLYTYSANGFASIPLTFNGTWSKLTMGEAVSGAACVKGGIDGNNDKQALYVVGGTCSSSDYSGLQRYSFQDQRWETINPTSPVVQNRIRHGVAYLNASSSILVYAGSQPDDNTLDSSQTFAISTAPPYTVLSFRAQGVSPATSPVLLSWNNEEAALIGGSTSNKIFLFNQTSGWRDSGLSFTKKLSSKAGYALINGSDGSKMLESFGMDVSPNTVNSEPLLGPGGVPASPSRVVQASSLRKRKRSITLNGYPTYDGTFASNTTRADYSLAQDEDRNLVVISGGDHTDPLVIFNQTSNSWANVTKLFYGNEPVPILTPPAPEPTTAGNSTTSAAGSTGGSSHSNIGTIIGATLGSVIGFAVLLILILLFLRRQHKKKAAGNSEGDDKDRLSFQDRGMEPLAKSAYPMARSPVPMATASVDSLGIFSGEVDDEKSLRAPVVNPVTVPKSTPPKGSPLVTVESSKEIAVDSGDLEKSWDRQYSNRPGDRTTDEGWSKYFEGNNAMNLATLNPARSTTASNMTKSDYRGSGWPSLTPLDFGFLDAPKPLGHVISGSPTTEYAGSDKDGRGLIIPECQSARISSADSISVTSEDDDYDVKLPGDGVHENPGLLGLNSWLGRPSSSQYSWSVYNASNTDIPSTGAAATPVIPRNGLNWADTTNSVARKSSVLIPDEPPPGASSNLNSDMSWLNLNAGR